MERQIGLRAKSGIDAAAAEAAAGKRFFFAHQSVGYNIIDGTADALAAIGEPSFKVVKTRDGAGVSGPAFMEAEVGSNGDPLGKIADFEAMMDAGIGGSVDAAGMKLCYVDFSPSTDAAAVARAYLDAVGRLKAKYPNVKLMHFTAPLTSRSEGKKAALKRFFGIQDEAARSNAAREAYNAILRAELEKEGALLDIAALEASNDEGKAEVLTGPQGSFMELRPEYTYDGGHLNEKGRKKVAEEFIALLARL